MEDSGIDSDPKPVQEERLGGIVIGSFQASDSSCSSTSVPSPQRTNLKQLHRKLERRIEQAKKVQRLQEYKRTTGLIPIQRLPIPSKSPALLSNKEHHPLVDWDTDESEEDINFFPVKARDSRQELTDTFSIENMPLSGGEEDEDDLDLLPPQNSYRKWGCCGFPDTTVGKHFYHALHSDERLGQAFRQCRSAGGTIAPVCQRNKYGLNNYMDIRERVVPSASCELMDLQARGGGGGAAGDLQVVPSVPQRCRRACDDAEVPDQEIPRVRVPAAAEVPQSTTAPLDEFLRALALESEGPQVVPIAKKLH